MTDRTKHLYKEVPEKYVSRLNSFRESHSSKIHIVNGVEWNYISCGKGEETLLLLAGGMGKGEVFFLHVMEFERNYKVIVPTFPIVNSISELVAGIVSIMQKEEIDRYSVLGQSFGGILAQELISKYPDRVNKAILSNTTTSSSAIHHTIIKENSNKIKKLIRMGRIIPLPILKLLFTKKVYKLLDVMDNEERTFWQAYFTELIYAKTKVEEIATYRSMLDFADNYSYTRESFKNWKGSMLIFESDTDRSFDNIQKEAVRELFPEAQTYEFKDTGHLSLLVAREEYICKVKDFLEFTEVRS